MFLSKCPVLIFNAGLYNPVFKSEVKYRSQKILLKMIHMLFQDGRLSIQFYCLLFPNFLWDYRKL